jgi:hypothetical protein
MNTEHERWLFGAAPWSWRIGLLDQAREALEEIESRLRPFPAHYAGYNMIQRIADKARSALSLLKEGKGE